MALVCHFYYPLTDLNNFYILLSPPALHVKDVFKSVAHLNGFIPQINMLGSALQTPISTTIGSQIS